MNSVILPTAIAIFSLAVTFFGLLVTSRTNVGNETLKDRELLVRERELELERQKALIDGMNIRIAQLERQVQEKSDEIAKYKANLLEMKKEFDEKITRLESENYRLLRKLQNLESST